MGSPLTKDKKLIEWLDMGVEKDSSIFKRFLHGFLTAWTVVLVKGSIVQFPQTFGPYKSRVARVLAGYLLRRSSVIMARDRESQQLAKELVGHKRQREYKWS